MAVSENQLKEEKESSVGVNEIKGGNWWYETIQSKGPTQEEDMMEEQQLHFFFPSLSG